LNRALIDQALIASYVAGAFGLPTAYPNFGAVDAVGNSVTPSGEPWARITVLPSRPSVATMGSGGRDEISGILQIDLFYPRNTGAGAVNAKADQITAVFAAGTTHSAGGIDVISNGAGRVRSIELDDWYQVIVEVQFTAWIGR